MFKKILFISLFLLTISIDGYAQEQSIFIAGVDAKPGMTKEAFEKRMNSDYELQPDQKNSDFYYVIAKKDHRELLGTLAFKKGLMSFANRDWGQFTSSDAINLGDTLYDVIANITDQGVNEAKIETTISRSPDGKFYAIRLGFRNKDVILTVTKRQKSGESVNIQEYFGLPKW